MKIRKIKRWSAEEDALLVRLYPHTSNAELAVMLGRSVPSIVHRGLYGLGLRKLPGYLSNMSREREKAADYINLDNSHPVGHIVARDVGGNRVSYWIKYRESGPHSENWRTLASHVWVTSGREEPTDGEVVTFKDGYTPTSPDCFIIERLEKITRAELIRRNSVQRFPLELKRAILQLGRLKKELNNERHK